MSDADATVELQAAIINALKASAPVGAIFGDRIYDEVPADPDMPYVSFGPIQAIPEHAAEYVGYDTTLQIDAWAEGPKTVEIKKGARAITTALDEAVLLIGGHRLVSLTVEATQFLDDPDGITQHAPITIRALTEPTD